MTSKEAYLKIQEFINDMQLGITRSSLDIIEPLNIIRELTKEHAILEEYNVTPEILREVLLTGQMFRNQPTFSDCIKEWKKRGWKYYYDDYYNWHCFTNKKENDTIFIDSKDNTYWTIEMTFIDIELHHLLTKTLKALEELKDE